MPTVGGALEEAVLEVPGHQQPIGDRRILKMLLESIWVGDRWALLKDALTEKFEHHVKAMTCEALLNNCEQIVVALCNEGLLDREAVRALLLHRQQVISNRMAYQPAGRENPHALHWPNPSLPAERGGRALHGELAFAKRRKSISKATKIGSAGSCFAIEIRKYLVAHGYTYVQSEPTEWGSANWGGQYNLIAFQQTVEWAFGLRERPPLIWQCSDHGQPQWWDPFRDGIVHENKDEALAEIERHRVAARRALEEAEVFILTAGLIEVWRLLSSDQVLARYPRNFAPHLIRHDVLTVSQNVEALERTLNVLRSFNPEIRLIVTVSPVPLHATFQANDKHVIEATVLAKSVLRIAMDEFVRNNSDRVSYFPAFETVMWCSKDPWEQDARHVRRETVANVMRLFEEIFLA